VGGRFITLEGGEGVGKSTQLQRLAEAIRARGHDVLATREPGGSPGAESIRSLLLEGEGERWTAETETLLFAAARVDHIERTIKPALQAGKWVLCDRFVDSTSAYQGSGLGVGPNVVAQLHKLTTGEFLPDRTLLLDLPEADAAQRARIRDEGAADRIGGRSEAFHRTVQAAFRELAHADPGRIRIVDAAGSPEEVTGRLFAAIEDLF
jgi:dTMP kinase